MGKIAFVFAGQGAQYPGMGKDLYQAHPTARAVFNMIAPKLRKIVFGGPAEELNQTINTQPALFAMDLACAQLLREGGVKPDAIAGFSLGEIPAAAFAGLMSIPAAFDFVCYRAAVMNEAAGEKPGTMLAVLRLSAERVAKICSEHERAYPVNYNCPGQTVVACAAEVAPAIEAAVAAAGGRGLRLPVSGAFHSPFMAGAAEKIRSYLSTSELALPSVPLYSNVTARRYGGDMRELLTRQVCSPVLWQSTIENMSADGVDTFIEVGAGKVLTGLIKKISPGARVMSVGDCESLAAALSEHAI